MKKKFIKISGITLLEMLIGIVISSIMMGALYTSYTVVNGSYTQVADKETISRTGRDIVGMLLRDIRMAGYFDVDSVKIAGDAMHPLIIGKSTNFSGASRICDKIRIVYGDIVYNKGSTPEYEYPIYEIDYRCKKSTIPNRKAKKNAAGTFPTKDLFAIYKQKKSWNKSTASWNDPTTDNDPKTYAHELIIDHVEDVIFNPIDANGDIIKPAPNRLNLNRLYEIRSVDILIMLRSPDPFYKNEKPRTVYALSANNRNKKITDKFLRESIAVTANARNIGIAK